MADAEFLKLLFVRRHLVKYLQANLDPARRSHLPHAEDIAHDIAELLPRAEVVALEDTERTTSLRITLRAPNYADIPKQHHDKIVALLEECFREEFFYFVKQQHIYMRTSLEHSVLCFMGQYGLTDDDVSLDDMKRRWRRMATNRGKPPERPGRPMKPFAALKFPRTRDRVRRMMEGWPPARNPRPARPVRTGKPKAKSRPAPEVPGQLSFFPPTT